ncbi:thioredoxin family protein [Salegentibacter sp. F188]|uniref:Thioredoxin family protein n=1 Tax=Autumnicola patrickiae TaxID=3075591 RepID=A0ABU3E4Y9_9FLAO|nr:thioredoxin family protein [Salegentibacter sp. F188]MDT0691053.1 thioredoxin family protein [Salegentibacter sp. F188]
MNKLLLLFLGVLLSCGSNGKFSKTETASETAGTFSAQVHRHPPTAVYQKDMLLGEFQREELKEEPFSRWFEAGYSDFDPNDEAMQTIKENISDYEITLVMGTWCVDSKRETPKFFKILDEANYDTEKLTSIAVDTNKSTPGDIQEELNVEMVPTIIFYKDGKEVNRFVEYPQESIEEDIAKIVSGEEYSHPYAQ